MIKKILITSLISILIVVSFTLMLYSKVLSESEILKQLDEMNYYEYVYKDIMEKLEVELPNKDLAYIYNKYVTKDQIRKDVKNILDNYYTKSNTNIKKEFYNNIIKNFKNQNDENIKSLVNVLANTYYNNLFRTDKFDQAIKLLPLKDSSRGLAFISLIAAIILIAKYIKEIDVYNSFIVSGIVFLIPKIFIILRDVLKNFYYFNNSLSYFIKMYGYSIINTYFKYGILLIIIGLIGFIIQLFRKDNWLEMSNDI